MIAGADKAANASASAQRRPASDRHPRRVSQRASQFAVWRKRSQQWRRLIVAARRGERRAYDQLLRELDAWLFRYYARRLPRAAAEDARQDALLAIHAKLHTYAPSKPFGPWLAAIARYKWIDNLRAASRFAALPLDEDVPVKDGENAAISAISVHVLLSRLKPAQAEVIRLVKLQGASIEEASGATGQSIPLVKVNIHRGLKKLAVLATSDAWAPAVVGA